MGLDEPLPVLSPAHVTMHEHARALEDLQARETTVTSEPQPPSAVQTALAHRYPHEVVNDSAKN